jgi:hypothetical protein
MIPYGPDPDRTDPIEPPPDLEGYDAETRDWVMVALGLTVLLAVIVLSIAFNPAGCSWEQPC